MPYKEIASGLSYSSDWVGKVYRSWRDENRHTEIVPKQKTLRLMNNTMTDTPRSYLILYAGDSRGCRGSGGWASNRVVDSILKF